MEKKKYVMPQSKANKIQTTSILAGSGASASQPNPVSANVPDDFQYGGVLN